MAGRTAVDAIPVELPPDRRASPGGGRVAGEDWLLPNGTVTAAERTCEAAGTTLFDAFVASACAVLRRHTGHRHLLVGVGPPGAQPGVVPVPGAQPGVVPVAVDIDPAESFAALARRTGRAVREASGRGAGSPRVVLDTASGPAESTDGVGAPLTGVRLSLTEFGGTVLLRLRYDSGRYDRPTAERFLRHCGETLYEALRRPAEPLRDVAGPKDPASWRHPTPPWALPVPDGFTAPTPPAPAESLVDRFRTVAAAHRDRVAVSGPTRTYRYGELDLLSTACAHRLRALAPENGLVALLCEHDSGVPVAVWSVLKAGYAYVPLDARQPNGRLAALATAARISVVICDPALADRAAAVCRGATVVPLTADVPDGVSGRELPAVGASDLAYLLHTSGSTGRPKAVTQTHANVLAHALTYADRIRIGAQDAVSLLPRITFDAAVMDLFGAHLSGAALHIAEPQAPAAQLRAWLAAGRISVLHCTPTLYRHLLTGAQESGATARLGTVRVLVLGGEEVTTDDVQQFQRWFPSQCAMVNGLGPTECTLVLQHLVTPADLTRQAVPVGHPVAGIRVRLLDDEGRPTDVLGELQVLSDRVATGYWQQPEATRAVFGAGAEGRYYRTGDLVRTLPDGTLVFCGRKDRQVKIRGNRIEPAEVEAVLRKHGTVAQSAVIVDPHSGPAPRLIGYVTSATRLSADAGELMEYLGRHLPGHAVPWKLVVLDRMPVGPSGKLDHAALPAPSEFDTVSAGGAPRTALEKTVAAIWCAVLRQDSADVNADFMTCGGDSLTLMELLAELKNSFDIDVPLADFLRQPTIAGLARLLGPHTAR